MAQPARLRKATAKSLTCRALVAASAVIALFGHQPVLATAAEPCDTMLVQRLRVDVDAPDPVVPAYMDYRAATIRVEGRFQPIDALQDYDPARDSIRVTVGSAYVLSAFEQPGSRLRLIGRRVTFESRRMSRRHGHRLVVDLRRGRFTAVVRSADAGGLLAEGPQDVTVSLVIGDIEYRETIDLVSSTRRWGYRAQRGVTIPPPPVPDPPPVGEALPHVLLGSGEYGWRGPLFPRAFIVRAQAELDQVWAYRNAGEAAPAVNFGTEMVIFVDLGRRPSLGYRVDVRGVSTGTCGPVISYSEFAPSTGQQAEGFPWTAVTVPAAAGIAEWRVVPE